MACASTDEGVAFNPADRNHDHTLPGAPRTTVCILADGEEQLEVERDMENFVQDYGTPTLFLPVPCT